MIDKTLNTAHPHLYVDHLFCTSIIYDRQKPCMPMIYPVRRSFMIDNTLAPRVHHLHVVHKWTTYKPINDHPQTNKIRTIHPPPWSYPAAKDPYPTEKIKYLVFGTQINTNASLTMPVRGTISTAYS